MTKLWNKLFIHPLTYFIILISLMTGLIKYLILIGLIIIIHESGHIIIATIFKRKISKVELLPFGGLIKMDSLLSENIFEDLLIAIGGIAFQLIFGLIIFLLANSNVLNETLYSTLKNYNALIISFNLIPVCPLDGYKILKLLEELIIPFKKTFILSFVISSLILSLAIIFKMSLAKENLLIFLFIIFMSIEEIKNRKHIMNRFYLERKNRTFNFNRNVQISKKEDMFKNRNNYIGIKDEHTFLEESYRKTCKNF